MSDTEIAHMRLERSMLVKLLRQWYELFASCRRDGTVGADLIDRTALMLQMMAMMSPMKATAPVPLGDTEGMYTQGAVVPTKKEALEALDSMDDYCRMANIVPVGPHALLLRFIENAP